MRDGLKTARAAEQVTWRGMAAEPGCRMVAEEVPIALSFNGVGYAVMLATPADLEDFAVGFSLTEGIIDAAGEVEEVVATEHPDGVVLSLWLAAPSQERLRRRQRRIAGPAGCGLCGIESLAEAVRSVEPVRDGTAVGAGEIEAAVRALRGRQVLNEATRAVHGAGFFRAGQLVAVREDVGRHNALDKLAGCLARDGRGAAGGLVVLSSRVSVELVQKVARMGVGVLAAVSAPTGLAIRTAEAAGLTLVGVARDDGFEVFTHPGRVVFPATAPAI